jgi:NAD dependent epimerase/dehydratase family enzyme
MRVLVTEATGDLGQVLVRRLVADGHAVSVLTRMPFLASSLLGSSVRVHEWHPLSEDLPADAVAGVSAVAHLMDEPVWGKPARDRLVHVKASRAAETEKLMAALAGRQVRLVAASRVCTSASPDAEIGKEDVPRQEPQAPFEAALLRHEERLAQARSAGNSVAVVRLGLVLGNADTLAPLRRLAMRRIGFSLEGSVIPAIDIEDAAALFAGLLDLPDIEGYLNGVAPEPLHGEDLVQAITDIGGRPLIRMPRRAFTRYAGELAPSLLNRVAIAPSRLLQAGARFENPDPKVSLLRTLAPPGTADSRRFRLWRPGRTRTSGIDPAVPTA